jgi:hypothetical protein
MESIMSINKNIDVKDSKVQAGGGYFDGSVSNNIHMGGMSARYPELNSVIGGEGMKLSDIQPFLEELLTDNTQSNSVGFDGVEITGLSPDTVTVQFTNAPQVDTLMITGPAVQLALGQVSGIQGTDLGDNKSGFKIAAVSSNDHLGGSTGNISGEFNDIVGGTFKADDGAPLFAELVSGLAPWKTDNVANIAGVDGVKLIGLTTDSYAVALERASGTVDTVLFTNAGAAIAGADNGNIDVKDGKSQFAIWDSDAKNSIFVGGTSAVSADLNKYGGSSFKTDKIDDILTEIVLGNGIDDKAGTVDLLSVTKDAFAIAIDSAGGTVDTLLITGSYAEAAIEQVFGFDPTPDPIV